MLAGNGFNLGLSPTYALTEERAAFAAQCIGIYKTYFPEILEEIQGIADGNGIPVQTLHTLLFSMYCFAFDNKCTCFAVSTEEEILFARNSDFLVSIEEMYMNCQYRLQGSHPFQGNTTAFVQMEDGVNDQGLAAGLTALYPHARKPGFNSGILIRFLLEKCGTVAEALAQIQKLPLATSQTITLADKTGAIAVAECSPAAVSILHPQPEEPFVVATNNFHSAQMKPLRNPEGVDDWRSEERYQTAYRALSENKRAYSTMFIQSVLAGKHGFLCQYDRAQNADTVWSVVYDLKRGQIWRVEGNPSQMDFQLDTRFHFA